MTTQRLLPAFLLALIVGGMAFGAIVFGVQDSELATTLGPVAAIGAVIVFMIVFVAMERFGERYDVQKRVDVVRRKKPGQLMAQRSIHEKRIIQGQSKVTAKVASSVSRYMGISGEKMPEIRMSLMQAGFLGDRAVVIYLVLKILLPVIGLTVGGFYGYSKFIVSPPATVAAEMAKMPGNSTQAQLNKRRAELEAEHLPANPRMMALAAALAGALFMSMAVESVLKSRAKQRAEEIWEDLPDAIDLMVIFTETGATIDTALPKIVAEIKENCPALALEFTILRTELRLQTERGRAYENLTKRIDLPAVRTFVSIVKQSENMGTPVTESLAILGNELRRERMLYAERRAAKIPVLITIPLMIFIMPALFIVVLSPTVIRIYYMFQGGALPGTNP